MTIFRLVMTYVKLASPFFIFSIARAVITEYYLEMKNNGVFQTRVPDKLRVAALAGAAKRGKSLAECVRELMEQLAKESK